MEEGDRMESQGYCTVTYRLKLYRKHLDWMDQTKALYNNVVRHYYEILMVHRELLQFGNHSLMRELEKLSVGTKEMRQKKIDILYPLDQNPKIPLYFRRAAINHAISLFLSYRSLEQNWKEQKQKTGAKPSPCSNFSVSPVFYKGMYREFGNGSICLKLYNGSQWIWSNYRYTGRKLPEHAAFLSPTLCLRGKDAWLHVPVVTTVSDIRTVSERVQEGMEQKIFSISFPTGELLAVGAVFHADGSYVGQKFFSGGRQLNACRQALLRKVDRTQNACGANRKYYEKIEALNDAWAHKISREIVAYCIEQQMKLIIVPGYEKRQKQRQTFEWLGRRIIRYVKYKAFAEGILVTAVHLRQNKEFCSFCGGKISHSLRGEFFVCEKGHRGNAALNTARNLGQLFITDKFR